ncbi:MAG TPA: nitrogenase iron-molybdenum cofactor biosynthesis protein NifN [Candidatus Competibacteraceae bacterium]|nr:nitrogenase iron-molybdenum cofactor biosynthesis protein NifN [Candidatus Competibacteraceae bacterium]MCP5133310.1 nitrogenase iron-molybdenum cofactor biosynthesis protein NifN [Gammaproteobacteria bacterium]HPF57277.1 nitrogenase iron-molybdenum cofactor biosynthesis protein NifN [Candidatus Competibacteraceae bacterium]HRY17908.1 nitrogenase iron-molybdenum cofactor biosynthesis protein NifN [Candidatus Competibacteraceae bacterium]
MAEVIRRSKPLSVSPLKTSQPLGASLAILGLNRAIPLLHGAQGCTAFAKVFLVRHFREPIPLQTSALDPISSIMGADDSLLDGLRTVCEKHRPAAVGLLTTGLTEAQGTDIQRVLKIFRERYPEFQAVRVVPVNTPDFSGCLESGFAATVKAMISEWAPLEAVNRIRRRKSDHSPRRVNVLCGASLTPGDLEVLRELIERFDLHPVFIPDLSDSLDGHLDAEDYNPLTTGGTPLAAFATLDDAIATLVMGASLYPVADLLHERTRVPVHCFPHLFGLDATDRFVMTLAGITGQPVPAALTRQRAQLQDAMLDTHFLLGRARIAIAAEPDLLHGFSQLLADMGAEVVAAIAPAAASILPQLPLAQVHIGDLDDLERLVCEHEAELLIGSSHVTEIAQRLGLPLLRAGYPLHDQFGGYQRAWIGYRGARQGLFDLANALLAHAEHAVAPYHSIYSLKADERREARHGATQASTDSSRWH